MLTDKAGRLTGLFTDSDLARLFERRDETALDRPIRDVMAAKPTTVPSGTRVADAVALLAQAEVQRAAGRRQSRPADRAGRRDRRRRT